MIANHKREFPADIDPGMKKLMHDAIASEIEVLRSQVDHYEKLREGRITSREITSLHELPIALIEARIAAKRQDISVLLVGRELSCRWDPR